MKLFRSIYISIFVLAAFGPKGFSQQVATKSLSASEIQLKLKHLNVLGTVLYIAAHPDDENTRMISWLALDKGYKTSYMSLTRGDGGQNLIGSEQGIELGLMRTQELLAARHLDGGNQYFSSAYDFGFSKNPEETYTVWDKDKVLSEVVWVIRTLKPDVIITRFTPEPSATHGHHTASAQLALEAFTAAADPQKFPEQLRLTDVWQTKRIFWNTSWFFYGSKDYDKTGLIKVETGSYIPQLGQSVGERAAESRSQHRSQGFGSARQRGEEPEYLKPLAGEAATSDLMDHVQTGWSRVKGAENVEKLISKTIAEFKTDKPQASIAGLLEVRKELKKLNPSHWRNIKLKDTEYLITQCAGFFGEALMPNSILIQGDSLKLNIEMINRLPIKAKIGRIFVGGEQKEIQAELKTNTPWTFAWKSKPVKNFDLYHPYWLAQAQTKGMFVSGTPENSVAAFNKPAIEVFVELFFENENDPITVPLPVVFKYTEPDRGELYKYPEIVPALSVNTVEPILILKPGDVRKAIFKIISHGKEKKTGKIVFKTQGDVQVASESINFEIAGEGTEKFVDVLVSGKSGSILPQLQWDQSSTDRSFKRISYTHIPNLVLQSKTELKVLQIPVISSPLRIGYIKGAGDEIPKVLRQLGYTVDEIEDAQLESEFLKRFDVVIAGIRAYNTRDALAQKNTAVLDYVKNGGRLLVQYNTSNGLVTDQIGPYPMKLTRNRITVEEAPLEILQPANPIFNVPNKITESDFDGWVQERGLYFVGDSDPSYIRLLKGKDPKEEASDGLLLYTDYGKGKFIYTGISFFRQLPAGNAGAIRLFVNLLESK
jgi:LmbE family N-acetylglucosaminyl deacetylase